MKENTTRRDFLRGTASLALLVSGCSAISQRSSEIARDGSRGLKSAATRINPPGYATNASNRLSASEFGDKYFNSRKSVVTMHDKEYVFMPTQGYDVIVGEERDKDGKVTKHGNVLSEENYLPFAAFDRSQMTVTINPQTKQVTYGYDNGNAIVFARDNTIGKLNTGIRGKMRPAKSRIAHVSEPVFEIPTVHFGLRGYENVAHAKITNGGQLVLAPNPSYAVNMARGGILQIIPKNGAYVETEGKLQARPQETAPSKQADPLEVTVERVPQVVPVQAQTQTTVVDPNSN